MRFDIPKHFSYCMRVTFYNTVKAVIKSHEKRYNERGGFLELADLAGLNLISTISSFK